MPVNISRRRVNSTSDLNAETEKNKEKNNAANWLRVENIKRIRCHEKSKPSKQTKLNSFLSKCTQQFK